MGCGCGIPGRMGDEVSRVLPLLVALWSACSVARPPGDHVIRWCESPRPEAQHEPNFHGSMGVQYQLEGIVSREEILELEAEFLGSVERVLGLAPDLVVEACGKSTVLFSRCEILLDGDRLRGLNFGRETFVFLRPGWKATLSHEWIHRILRASASGSYTMVRARP